MPRCVSPSMCLVVPRYLPLSVSKRTPSRDEQTFFASSQAEIPEGPADVVAQPETGAALNLLDVRDPLEELMVDPVVTQRDRGGEPGDPRSPTIRTFVSRSGARGRS